MGLSGIKICNSGEPIGYDVLPKIFDPFFTTKDANKGTGMGLTLVYNLVKEQQGDLLVQNLDQGVMFTVTLPRVEKI
ncbi:MAG: HAMP domain-containing histidine kinase [Salinivirgaceae bacterium]|nr:HAMP domain-containing histidine kinase [Salinivirgaceae bacterium]